MIYEFGKLDEILNSELKKDYKSLQQWVEHQRNELSRLHGHPRGMIIINDDEHAELKHYASDVYKRNDKNELVYLGLLLNKQFKPEPNMSILSDERLRRLCEYDVGWFRLAERIQERLNNGLVIKMAKPLLYDHKFKYNIKHPTLENNYLGYDVIKECSTELLMPDDEGIDNPAVLRGWLLESIPGLTTLPSGVEFDIRKSCVKRINDEAPMYPYTNLFEYAARRIDLNDPMVQLWLEHFIGAEDFFSFNGRMISCDKSLLAHKKFEMMVTYLRTGPKFNLELDGIACLKEAFVMILPDPTYNSYKCRGAFGDLNQHVFAKTSSGAPPISINNISSTNFKLEHDTHKPMISSSLNVIDEESVVESYNKLKQFGLHLNAKLLLESQYYQVNKANMKLGKVNRIVLSYCGYTGTHAASAIVSQFTGTRDKGPSISKEFYDAIVQNTYNYMDDGLERGSFATPQSRLDVLFKGGTSSASSTFEHKSVNAFIKYNTPFLTHKALEPGKVLQKKDGTFQVITKISAKLRTKNANIITNPANFTLYSSSDLERKIKAGSRLVRGTRDKRIITPTYGSIYFTMLLTILLAVRMLSMRRKNRPALTTEGRVGTTYVGALPHEVMLPMLAVTSNDPSYFILAVDFGQFDSSQHGDISKAHAEGVRMFASKYTPDRLTDDHDTVDLLKVSQHKLFMILADAYEKPMLYEGQGIVAEAAGVKSGELSTQLRNTITNMAHSELVLTRYNANAKRHIRMVHENIVGDDKYGVFRMVDKQPIDEESARRIVEVARDIAEENHMVLSTKRTVIGNKVGEHIKIWVARGYLTQDVFLDSFVSEKNSFREMSYLDRMTTLYDIFMTMLTRFADVTHLMPLFMEDLISLEGVRSGDLHFIPTIACISAIGGPEMVMSAPEIRGMARYMHKFDVADNFKTINDLVVTLREKGGSEGFKRQILSEIGSDSGLVDKTWIEHFKRKRDRPMNIFTTSQNDPTILKLTPEYVEERLTKTVVDTLDEPVSKYMNNNVVMRRLFTSEFKGQLRKADEPKYQGVFYLLSDTKRGITSPYLGADAGVQRVHEIIGLADRNANMTEPTAQLDALLRRNPGSHPAYLTGQDIFNALSRYEIGSWKFALETLDFDPSVAEQVISLVSQTMHRFLADKDVNMTSIFDNTSRTYDVSDEMMRLKVNITEADMLNVNLRKGMSFEGMKHVLYMARKGYAVKATMTPHSINNVTIIDK
uniref:RdRp n=1 Tax=viral metagenome TaxID=1070528 RepID=A0A2V0R901_9ZZZZ